MGIGRYFKIALRWWWLILLSVGVSATASYYYSQEQPRIYAARTTVMVGANVISSSNPNEQALGLSRSLAEIYAELVRRRPITQAVVDRLELEMGPDDLSGMIQTNIILNTQLLEIFVLDVHPQRAQLLANAIAEELLLQSPGGAQALQERDKFVRTQLAELQAKIEANDLQIKELENSLSSIISAVEISEAQSKLTELEKLKTDYQANYNQFLSNLSDSSINRLAIFEPAIEPTTPVSPNVQMNVLIAAAAGLMLAISAIVVVEFMSDVLVWQPGETQSVLGLPILGAIGKVADKNKKIIGQDGTWSPEVDALRTLRSSIMLAAEGRPLNTLLITSTGPAEGKSYLAANLAVIVAAPGSSLAAVISSSGSRVILIDADLRHPSLHELFDMPNLLGLADVLAVPETMIGSMLNKALRATSIDNLQLLPAGRTAMDPGAMLASAKFKEMLEVLKNQADLIIIDSDPLLKAVETKAIANVVDGTVLVINNGQTRRKLVQQAIDYFKKKQNNNLLGVVFNRTKATPVEYYSQSASQGKRRWFGGSQQTDSGTLTLAEVTDYLGVSEETVRRWCEQGRVPASKQGRRWSVRLEDLNEFIGAYQATGSETNKNLVEAVTLVEGDVLALQNVANGQK